jgi:general secretion pathway protein D
LLRAMLTAVMVSIASAFPIHATGADERFTLNLKNVDIRSLIETVSRQTGRNFIVDPRVKATVTVISSEPVDADKLYDLFLSVLDVHGYAAVPAGAVTKIVPMQVGVQSAVPVLGERGAGEQNANANSAKLATKAEDDLITEVVSVQHTPVQQLAATLRPLLPQSANIGAEPSSNTIVITDSAANIARIVEIIRLLDQPN